MGRLGDAWDWTTGKAKDAVTGKLNMDIGRWGLGQLGLDPSKPYQDAASGMRDLAGMERQFSDTQWDRQMQGLGGALGSYSGSDDYWRNNFQNQGPGAAEQAFNSWGAHYMTPGKTGDTYDTMNAYAKSPTETQRYGSQAMNYLGGPTQQSQNMGQIQSFARNPSNQQNLYGETNMQLAEPSQSQGQYDSYKSAYGSAGAAERYAGDAALQMGMPGTYEDWYKQNQQRYAEPSDTQNLYAGYGGSQYKTAGRSENFQTHDVTAATDYANEAMGRLRLPGQLEREGADIRGRYADANDIQRFNAENSGTLGQQGIYEQFAQSALGGTNPYLDRIRSQGNAALNQQMAKRGQFSSGGAMTALGNYNSGLDAENFKNLGALAQGGQQMQLARMAQGQGLAQATSGEKMDVAGRLQGLATGRESEFMGRNDAMARAAQMASTEQTTNQSQAMQAASAADQARMARLSGLSSLAGQSSADSLARLQAGEGAAGRSQQMAENRVMSLGSLQKAAQEAQQARMAAGMAASGQADQSLLARIAERRAGAAGADDQRQKALALLQKAGSDADADSILRGNSIFGIGKGIDESTLSRMKELGVQGKNADDARRLGMDSYFRAAGQSQDAARARQQDGWNSRFGLDSARAGLYGNFYNQGGKYSGDAFGESAKSMASALGLDAQGAAALQKMLFDLGGKFAGGYLGGAGGGGVGQG